LQPYCRTATPSRGQHYEITFVLSKYQQELNTCFSDQEKHWIIVMTPNLLCIEKSLNSKWRMSEQWPHGAGFSTCLVKLSRILMGIQIYPSIHPCLFAPRKKSYNASKTEKPDRKVNE